jgi:hypothetical protein
MTAVIDATANITGVGATFTGSFSGTTGSFSRLLTASAGISAAGGVTFSGTLQGTTASFTGLVSSTVGFSGSATNLVGNANGLTAGTASRVQIAEGAGSNYYLVLAGGAGNTGVFVDTSTPRWGYNAGTGALVTTTGYVEAATLYATTAIYANTLEGFDGTSPLNIVSPYYDGTNQAIYIGDTNGSQNGTVITVDDALSLITFDTGNIDYYGNLNIKNSAYLTFYDADYSNYIAFRGPTALAANTTWTLPSADGSANQVLTTNGLGTLSWSTPSGGGSSVTSFNGLTGAVTGVSRVNGFTAGITFAAGSGITFTASGGTITLSTTGGGFTRTIVTTGVSASAGSAASTDYVYIGTTSGNINITLPTAVSNTNRYTVKQSSIGTITILTTSSQTMDGVTAYNLNKQYQAVDFISDNANWHIL